VVIDVLRASTTITTALAAGAAAVVPCLEITEARELAFKRPGSLLGGERRGQRIEGFDLGNSPADYVPERVAGKTIVFTTTNGTRALNRCTGAGRVLIGGLVNRQAVCRALQADPCVHLVCAGTGGEFSFEDALAAGAMVQQLATGEESWQVNDAARICRLAWESDTNGGQDAGRLLAALAASRGGRNLIEIGLGDDLPWAAELDRYALVPELDQSTWRIVGDPTASPSHSPSRPV
jgi:2-phosphosulfolactate phosphatase